MSWTSLDMENRRDSQCVNYEKNVRSPLKEDVLN